MRDTACLFRERAEGFAKKVGGCGERARVTLSLEAVAAGAREFQPAPIAQDLELLADFRPDVAVGRVKGREPRLEGVNLVQGEFGPADQLDGLHHLDQPAARRAAGLAQEKGNELHRNVAGKRSPMGGLRKRARGRRRRSAPPESAAGV